MDGGGERADTRGMDLFTFARVGDSVLLQEIDDGYDVNSTDENGDTLVMLAAVHGHASLVRGLVARGADVLRHNANGSTPQGAAAAGGHHDIAEIIRRAATRTMPSEVV